MRLSVRHETHYDYDTPLAYSAQRLHLWPVDFASQKTIAWSIAAPGFERALSYWDGFGNRVHMITYGSIEGPVSVVAEGVVEVEDAAGVVRGLGCPAPEAVFLRQTKATAVTSALRSLAERQFTGRPVLDGLHALMNEIHAKVAYELGATHAHTTAAEAFADGRGVCQDHAHIFLAAARSAGIPARYAVGFSVSERDGERWLGRGRDAHAWALVWNGQAQEGGRSPAWARPAFVRQRMISISAIREPAPG